VLIGADGVNGVVGRAGGLIGGRDREMAVAYEGNIDFPEGVPAQWRETAALDLGLIPGGYGWLFPKCDHVNVGVGGWKYTGPTLRRHLTHITRHYGLDPAHLQGLRGYQLPVRTRGARIARGRIALVGDAAGLVDPLSGEGIYAAIASGRAAARHALAAIDGRNKGLAAYQAEVERMLVPELTASSQLQDLFNLAPPVYVALLRRSDLLWTLLCRIIRGEGDYATFKRRSGPFSLIIDALSWSVRHSALGRVAGRPEWATALRAAPRPAPSRG
jgi:flavin-dependent dehydrogenase